MNYELLPIEITQNGGHHYSQVWRDDHAAVDEQRNAFGAFLGYEAIAIKRAAPCHAFGRDYPARELPTGVWEKIRKAILTCAVGSDGNSNGSLFDLARIVRRYEEELIKRLSLQILGIKLT